MVSRGAVSAAAPIAGRFWGRAMRTRGRSGGPAAGGVGGTGTVMLFTTDSKICSPIWRMKHRTDAVIDISHNLSGNPGGSIVKIEGGMCENNCSGVEELHGLSNAQYKKSKHWFKIVTARSAVHECVVIFIAPSVSNMFRTGRMASSHVGIGKDTKFGPVGDKLKQFENWRYGIIYSCVMCTVFREWSNTDLRRFLRLEQLKLLLAPEPTNALAGF